ncbi:hypothetical protein [Sabulibacter ruber]|uniref:hypothetical protein n=1 Tax=Sabulibacter ruber TaxID=2811901 RepID=UPI001A976AA4|nr:hypothetical protein [Sabulibacter ruber]
MGNQAVDVRPILEALEGDGVEVMISALDKAMFDLVYERAETGAELDKGMLYQLRLLRNGLIYSLGLKSLKLD